MLQTITITVKGKVQGVNFRAAARKKAEELAITGHVKNLADGDVEITATGTEVALHALMDWCKIGPPLATVEDVVVAIRGLQNFRNFVIRR